MLGISLWIRPESSGGTSFEPEAGSMPRNVGFAQKYYIDILTHSDQAIAADYRPVYSRPGIFTWFFKA
ncbi:hypothetical protein BOMU111920_22410 [Bordetella muralis]|jgi:hypothetical protein